MNSIWPAVFFGHGNPMNAIQSNGYTAAWRAMGMSMGKPHAILMISAHWFVPEVAVTINSSPRTIHDFGGFPEELYEVQYPAGGDPELARRVQKLLAPVPVKLDDTWGLDHGSWSVLRHVYPAADVPVVQLSIDASQPAAFHLELGRKLAPLRREGILIAGSGNLVHNLHTYAWGRHEPRPYDWATRFELTVRELLSAGKQRLLVDYEALGPDAILSVPTPDHYLPLLYVIGTQQADDLVAYPVEGVDGGSISMLSVVLDPRA
jgi:4,5-DOPA dioxygenase extradiol